MATEDLQGIIAAQARTTGFLQPTFGSFAPETDHVNTGLARLTEQYKDKPRMKGLLQSYLNQIQDLEDAAWSVMWGYNIYKAVGVQLDTLGAIVGEARQGLTDTEYRAMLFVRILINLCNSTVPEILTIFERFYPGAQYELIQYDYAYFSLRVVGVIPESPSSYRFNQVLQTVKAGGVRADLIYQTVPETEVKKFDTTGQGFDSGKWATTEV